MSAGYEDDIPGLVPAVSVDVDAISSAEYDKGYADGILEGVRVGGIDGYRRGIEDLIGRLKGADPFTQEAHGHCLVIINEIARSMLPEVT